MLPCCFHWQDLVHVMQRCMWRSAIWLMASCHFLLWSLCVCSPEESRAKRAKTMGGEANERGWGNVCEREEKADSYRWNSRLLASLPHTGSGLERHIDRGRTPWYSELLMKSTLFNRPGFVAAAQHSKCMDRGCTDGWPGLPQQSNTMSSRTLSAPPLTQISLQLVTSYVWIKPSNYQTQSGCDNLLAC